MEIHTHEHGQPHNPQVGPMLFTFASTGKGTVVVKRVNKGKEVGGVISQAAQVELKHVQ